YYGVKSALQIGEENVLMMDIGGGSVEFIICNYRKIHWKKSFEIGAQRLMDQFMKSDPISELDLMRLEIFLEAKLYELSNAVFRYCPKYLIGSAGAFETLSTLAYSLENTGNLHAFMDRNFQLKVKEYTIEPDMFHDVYQLIVQNDREHRLALPGLMPLRADMIVMAMGLLRFILERYELEKIRVSAYALKEGYLMSRLNRN
ncbi:MAG: phosphatase, partial [Bacteroidota bacterium]